MNQRGDGRRKHPAAAGGLGHFQETPEMTDAALSVVGLDAELRDLIDLDCDCMGLIQF
jgi:hypothetical protein